MAEGQFAQAAVIFGVLADEASARAIPRAPQLDLQSGRAWILARDPGKGVPRLRQGFRLMAQMGQLGRLPFVARRVLGELRARGLAAVADALEAELRASLPGLDLQPAKCPYCGGNVHPDSVEWGDELSAACDCCGSLLEAEG